MAVPQQPLDALRRVQGEYIDLAVSGKRDSRPALNRLMEAARKRQIDAIICTKLDRWGRSVACM